MNAPDITDIDMTSALENIEQMMMPLRAVVATLDRSQGNSTELRSLRADAHYVSAGVGELRAKLHQHLANAEAGSGIDVVLGLRGALASERLYDIPVAPRLRRLRRLKRRRVAVAMNHRVRVSMALAWAVPLPLWRFLATISTEPVQDPLPVLVTRT